jgi:hypothetical protein
MDENEIWKCSVLIKQLIKRKEDKLRALENYPQIIYDEALLSLEKKR